MKNVSLYLLLLSPLLYSQDGSAIREETVVAVAALALSLLLLTKRVRVHLPPSGIGIILFAVVVVSQSVTVHGPSLLFNVKYAVVLLAMIIPALVYWSTSSADPRRPAAAIIRTLTIIFVISAAAICASYFLGIGEIYVDAEGASRAFGWMGDSFTPVLSFFVVFFVCLRRYPMAIVAVLVLLITRGKMAIVLTLLAPAVFLIAHAPRKRKIALGIVYLAFSFVAVQSIEEIYAALSVISQFEYSFNNRLLSLQSGIEYFEQNPWSGLGINQSMLGIEADTVSLAASLKIRHYYEVGQIHNAFIRTAAETGIPGLVCLLVFTFVIVRSSFHAIQNASRIRDHVERRIAIACSSWSAAFVLFYQTTGWFEAGHPQLAWLLAFHTVGIAVARRWHVIPGSPVVTPPTVRVDAHPALHLSSTRRDH